MGKVFGQESEHGHLTSQAGECALLTTYMAWRLFIHHSLLGCQLEVYVVLTKLVQEGEPISVFPQMNKPKFIIIEGGGSTYTIIQCEKESSF